MRDFPGLVLCDFHNDQVSVYVTVSLTDGELRFSGQDLGKSVKGYKRLKKVEGTV